MPFILRVSTHFGLEPMRPVTRDTMTRNLQELVYVSHRAHFRSVRASGRHAYLTRRPDSPLGAEALAAAVRHPELLAARADGDVVELTFSTDDAAQSVGLEDNLLDLGPYEPASFEPGRLSLRRRSRGPGPDRIEVLHFTAEEEWRRFLAREVDVVPFASPTHLRYLRDVGSVTVKRMEEPVQVALWMDARSSNLGDVRLRRAIALGLRRGPLAQVVNADPMTAVAAPEDVAVARALVEEVSRELGGRPWFTLHVYEGSSDLQRAALVIEEQLAGIGVEVRLVPVAPDAHAALMRTGGEFDALLFWGGYDRRYWRGLVSSQLGGYNFVGYASPEFDAAAEAGDEARARDILERDVPMTPLYHVNEGVAIDRSICGARPRVMYDLTWLAQLRRCGPGEEN